MLEIYHLHWKHEVCACDCLFLQILHFNIMQRVTNTKSKSVKPQYSFISLAATAYDFQYSLALGEEKQMVPVYGKEGHVTFTTRSAGPLAFDLTAK